MNRNLIYIQKFEQYNLEQQFILLEGSGIKNALKIMAISALPLIASCTHKSKIDIKPTPPPNNHGAIANNNNQTVGNATQFTDDNNKKTFSCAWTITFTDTFMNNLSDMKVYFNGDSVLGPGVYDQQTPKIIHGFIDLQSGDSLRFKLDFDASYKVDLKVNKPGTADTVYTDAATSVDGTVNFKIR